MSILVFNAGSTSLKFGLFTDPACALWRPGPWIGPAATGIARG